METTYVSVAIPYVNADPHLGYAYELVTADIYARARRESGDAVRFVGGTDDYSLKNVLAAEAAGQPTDVFVDAHAERFERLAAPLELTFDDFFRTSVDPRHRPAVERLWRACAARGDLYQRDYAGDYCVGCEQFYAADELPVDDEGRRCCPEHLTPVEWVAERNWFFRLSAYREHIEALITSGELDIRPAVYREDVLAFVRRGLDDISVSRSVARARGWGIPVPDDPSQVIYVWFDALSYYLSALRFGDPDSVDYQRWWLGADRRVHVIGKGIVRFHAVYWPAFLASAGQPAPTLIHVHPYLTVDGAKLSKSSGGGEAPSEIVDRFGTDALRWWCARDVAGVSDTDFTAARLVARANEDLANGLGNVANRIVTLIRRRGGDGYAPEPNALPIDAVIGLEADVRDALADFDLRRATGLVGAAIDAVNADLEATRPWARPPDRHLDHVLSRHLASVAAISRAVHPIVPTTAARVAHQLATLAPGPTVARLELAPAQPVPVT